MSAGKLIDDLGLKGCKIGDAMVSLKHANFIINDGNATSEDIISLIKYVQDKVKETYNVDLILEQEIIK
jgi:UDP-N-acetylmuramate dehydrogenase